MGLDIYARSTNGHISGGYERLHYTARYLALVYCGMPEYLDDKNEVPTMCIYMYPFTYGKDINVKKMQMFFYAIQISGIEFPNLLLHSDCEGTYTKIGNLDLDGDLMTGNSIKLLKELEKIVTENEFQNEKYNDQMAYTRAFYELVKKEVEEGKGVIEFR